MDKNPDLPCLPLDSPRWRELTHAYGSAADMPALLARLAAADPADREAAPWDDLFSALAHQGDVFDASFAAVPHVVRALAAAPLAAGPDHLNFAAWIEICRQRRDVAVPPDLAPAYAAALAALPGLVAAAAARAWDDEFLACALAAVAAAKGSADVAEAALALTPDVAGEFIAWLDER